MSAAIERDRAAAARASSWALWFLSLVAMGAAFASIHAADWPMAGALAFVMALLAFAAGSERQEMRAAAEQAELLELAAFDQWAGAWR